MKACPICNTNDRDTQGYCRTCIYRFFWRDPANKMMYQEKLREIKLITKHWATKNIPEEYKLQRLSELTGKDIGMKESIPRVLAEMEKKNPDAT